MPLLVHSFLDISQIYQNVKLLPTELKIVQLSTIPLPLSQFLNCIYCFCLNGTKTVFRKMQINWPGIHNLDTLTQFSTQRALTKFHDYQITNMIPIQ